MTADAPRQPFRIGFIGTGIMGFHMARRLAEAAHAVQAWNRSPEKADRLAAFGVQVVPRAADATRDADVVICMLSSGPVCDEVLLGGFADSTVIRQHGLRMVQDHFEPGRPSECQVKDTSTALAFAKTSGLALPVLGLVDRMFADMVSHGDGDLDHSAIIREIGRSQRLPLPANISPG